MCLSHSSSFVYDSIIYILSLVVEEYRKVYKKGEDLNNINSIQKIIETVVNKKFRRLVNNYYLLREKVIT
jgi:hypothetical protein